MLDKQLPAHRERIEDQLQREAGGDADDHLMNRDDESPAARTSRSAAAARAAQRSASPRRPGTDAHARRHELRAEDRRRHEARADADERPDVLGEPGFELAGGEGEHGCASDMATDGRPKG